MKIGNRLGWDVYVNVCAKVGIGDNCKAFIYDNSKVRSGDVEGFKYKFVDEFVSGNINSIDNVVKVVKGVFGVGVGVGGSLVWGVDIGFGAAFDSYYWVKMKIDFGSDLSCSDGLFDFFNDGKLLISLLYKSLEYNDGTLLYLYEIFIYVNDGFMRGVGIFIVRRLAIGVGGGVETVDGV